MASKLGRGSAIKDALSVLTLASPQIGGAGSAVLGVTAFNVKTYGAAGDGTTDDTVAIQAAVTAAGAAGGGTAFLPPGTYMIGADAIAFATDGVTLAGSGGYESIIKMADGAAAVTVHNQIIDLNASRVTIRDLCLDGNGVNQTAGRKNSGIALRSGGNEFLFENLVIRDMLDDSLSGGYGIVIWNGGGNYGRIANCHFEDIGQSDIGLFEGTDWVITNCTSINNGYYPINVETSASVVVSRVTVNGYTINGSAGGAITVIAGGGGTCEDVLVQNVAAYNLQSSYPTNGCIRVRGATRTRLSGIHITTYEGFGMRVTTENSIEVNGLLVEDLVFVGQTAGADGRHVISVEGSATYPVKNATFRDVMIYDADNGGIITSYAQDLLIENCRVNTAGSVNASNFGIDIVNGLRCQVRGCQVRGGKSYGVRVAIADYVLVHGCQISNNTTVGLRFQDGLPNYQAFNNHCWDDQGTKTQAYGIYNKVTTTNPNFMICNNELTGNLTGGYFNDGTGTGNQILDNNNV